MLSLQVISPAFHKNLKRTTYSLCNLYLKNNLTHLYHLKERRKKENALLEINRNSMELSANSIVTNSRKRFDSLSRLTMVRDERVVISSFTSGIFVACFSRVSPNKTAVSFPFENTVFSPLYRRTDDYCERLRVSQSERESARWAPGRRLR